MKALILSNRSAGGFVSPDLAIGDVLTNAGIDPEFRAVAPRELAREAAAAVDRHFELVVACGGDGTISTVANVLVGTDAILGILPLGTLNHFAKDLQIPLDLATAAKVIAERHTKKIDVGRVNDRIFINNSSLGVYSHLALERDTQNRKWRIGKWLALCAATLKMLIRFPIVDVTLQIEGQSKTRRSPVVFIGNNAYQFDRMPIGIRLSLEGGRLSLYIANTQSRWGICRMALRALSGNLLHSLDFEASDHVDIWVTTKRKSMLVAADGEVFRMHPPLQYRILPRSLRVCVPQPRDEPGCDHAAEHGPTP